MSSSSTTISHEDKKNPETPFVNQLIDENTRLKQNILTLSAELRALKAKPGSTEAFIEEIEALSNAIKSIRSQSETMTIEAARKRISETVDLHVQNENQNKDLPQQQSSSTTRISRLEDSMLTETERVALRDQRARLKKALDENLKFENIDGMVEEELQKRRRQQLIRQLEEESFRIGANVANSPASSTSRSANNNLSSYSSLTPLITSPLKGSVSRSLMPSTANANQDNRNQDQDQQVVISPVRVPRRPLPTDEEYKEMMNEEDRIAAALRDEIKIRQELEEAARNESLDSALKNPRDFSVPREREEKQQMIIANATPLRSALVKAQEDAFRLLKKDLEDAGEEGTEGNAADDKNNARDQEYKRKTRERLAALGDLEKHHKEMIQKGNVSAAAITV